MATVNYSWTLPTVGASVNTWGTLLNTIIDDIDAKMVSKTATQTLTNKTLTNPVINGFTGDGSAINIGSGQLVKDTSGNLGVGGAGSNGYRLEVIGNTQAKNTIGQTYQGVGASAMWIDSAGAWSLGLDSANGATTRVKVDSSGNLLLNTTSQIGPGKANIAYNAGTHYGLTIKETGGGTGAQFVTFYNSAGSAIGNIYNPTTTTIGYATSSDYRLKENIQPMVGAIERIKRLRPVTYTWAADGKPGEGFIAHELAEVCPDAVVGEKDAVRQETYEVSPAVPAVLDEDGREVSPAIPGVTETRTVPVYQGIDVSFLVGLLAAGMQELHAVVLEQADRIKALEARA